MIEGTEAGRVLTVRRLDRGRSERPETVYRSFARVVRRLGDWRPVEKRPEGDDVAIIVAL